MWCYKGPEQSFHRHGLDSVMEVYSAYTTCSSPWTADFETEPSTFDCFGCYAHVAPRCRKGPGCQHSGATPSFRFLRWVKGRVKCMFDNLEIIFRCALHIPGRRPHAQCICWNKSLDQSVCKRQTAPKVVEIVQNPAVFEDRQCSPDWKSMAYNCCLGVPGSLVWAWTGPANWSGCQTSCVGCAKFLSAPHFLQETWFLFPSSGSAERS